MPIQEQRAHNQHAIVAQNHDDIMIWEYFYHSFIRRQAATRWLAPLVLYQSSTTNHSSTDHIMVNSYNMWHLWDIRCMMVYIISTAGHEIVICWCKLVWQTLCKCVCASACMQRVTIIINCLYYCWFQFYLPTSIGNVKRKTTMQ